MQREKPNPLDQVREAYFQAVLEEDSTQPSSVNSAQVTNDNPSVEVTLMPRLRQKRKVLDWKLKCVKCERHFVTETLLQKHISVKHPVPRTKDSKSLQSYSCENSESIGKPTGMSLTNEELSGSSGNCRNTEKPTQLTSNNSKLSCPICDRNFINTALLNQHVSRTHLQSKSGASVERFLNNYVVPGNKNLQSWTKRMPNPLTCNRTNGMISQNRRLSPVVLLERLPNEKALLTQVNTRLNRAGEEMEGNPPIKVEKDCDLGSCDAAKCESFVKDFPPPKISKENQYYEEYFCDIPSKVIKSEDCENENMDSIGQDEYEMFDRMNISDPPVIFNIIPQSESISEEHSFD